MLLFISQQWEISWSRCLSTFCQKGKKAINAMFRFLLRRAETWRGRILSSDFRGNKCEKVCHVTRHKQQVTKLHFTKTARGHLSASSTRSKLLLFLSTHGWSRCWGRMPPIQFLHGLQTMRGNRMFVSLLGSLSISQMTQFTHIGPASTNNGAECQHWAPEEK